MKNVVNIKELDAALSAVARAVDDPSPAIIKWVETVGKKWLLTEVECFRPLTVSDIAKAYKQHPWMLTAYPRGTKIWEFRADDSDFRRFKDDLLLALPYLAAALTTRLNIQSVDFNTAASEGHRMRERLKAESYGEQDSDRKLIFKDGKYAWFELLNERALRRESSYMGHCVGNASYGYATDVRNGVRTIYSLRDDKNEPHATLEYRPHDKHMAQIKGKANEAVAPAYRPHVLKFLKAMIAKRLLDRISSHDVVRNNLRADELGLGSIDDEGFLAD